MKEIEVKCIIDDKKGEYSKIYRLELKNGEAIKILKQVLKAGGCISGLDLVTLQQAIETVLNMLKEKDEKIEKKNKIINLITEAMSKIQDSQVCEYCINNKFDCDDESKCKEGIKQYFESKVDSIGQ